MYELFPEDEAPFYDGAQSTTEASQKPGASSDLRWLGAADTSDHAIDEANDPLREISLQIHDRPELSWDVKYAHDILTQFAEEQGFHVTRHYLADRLPGDTAWKAEFVVPDNTGKALHVIGFNSEMDALPDIGHACGHNLIAVLGVAAAIGLKSAMEKHNIPGKIILLGTPAEERGRGKVHLLRAGAYKEMDICLMAHPGEGNDPLVRIDATSALQTFEVEYHGKSAHAGMAPWEGKNALDAVFVAYAAISALRQQLHPTNRIHGVIQGRDLISNIIPSYAKMRYTVRAPTWKEVVALRTRVNKCFEAGAHATSCSMTVTAAGSLKDIQIDEVLAHELGTIMTNRYNHPFDFPICRDAESGASTDFGNVTHELPALHPTYVIPTVPNGGNHTPEYAAAARTQEAHNRTIIMSKGLATLGLRALLDEEFLLEVKNNFEKRQFA